MAEQIIVCPNCKKEIPLTEVLSRTIKENARKEFESELQEKEAELAKKRESLEKQEQEMKANIKKEMESRLVEHKQYILKYDDDMPEIKNWKGDWTK